MDTHGLFQPHSHLFMLKILCVFISGLLHFICSVIPSEDMEKENAMLSWQNSFSQDSHISQKGKFPVLFVLGDISLTIMGNLGLSALICNDPRLHIPMYLFLRICLCGCLDIIHSDTPAAGHFFAKDKMMSLTECKIHFFPFGTSITTKYCWLATMAYDCYVATGKPLFLQLLWPINYAFSY